MKNTAKCASLADNLGDRFNLWHVSDKMAVWKNYEIFDIIFGIALSPLAKAQILVVNNKVMVLSKLVDD